jgi:CarD family transcriptional regulator
MRKRTKKKASRPTTGAPKARARSRKPGSKAASSGRKGVSTSGAGASSDAAASRVDPAAVATAMETPNVASASEPAAGDMTPQTSAAKPTRAVAETNASAMAAGAPVAAKTTKAATPTKTTERDEQGGEQKTMKNNSNRLGFKLNEFVVYPAHGVGQIVALEEQEVAGFRLELFVINFTKDKMTLRVPTSKVSAVGMRKLSDSDAARRSLDILTGRARIKRTMWSRRAQEYEAKINSGDINAIAEVVRDLYRSDAQPEQSYSERQLYEAALDRILREIAAVMKLS